MKLNFDFKHLDYSKSLELYTQESIDKIAPFLLKESSGTIFLTKIKGEFKIEVNIQTRQRHFKCRSAHFDVYSAVDSAVEKLERQLLKVRKINQNHKYPF